MKRLDWMVLLLALATMAVWTAVSGKDGFKSGNAMIVARSISVTSTIDGFVENSPPAVGALVTPEDLLVRIRDNRIDRGRLVDFDSEVEFLQEDIKSAERQQESLDEMLVHFEKKTAAHLAWVKTDTKYRNQENLRLLEIATQVKKLKGGQVARTTALAQNQHISAALLDESQTEAAIASSQVELNRSQVRRSQLMQKALSSNGAFFSNGDASYWERMTDEITLRQFDNLNHLATLHAQLNRAKAQAGVELTRIGSTAEEEHRAPFSGLVNATYITKGTRVTRGSSLLQLLDCANPIVIVPLPEHRISEFEAGMKVTVYPVDTEDALPGKIEYISSGPIIGHDQTLLVREDLTLRGVRAVVSFAEQRFEDKQGKPCQSAHRAVVVVHTDSIFRLASNWMSGLF